MNESKHTYNLTCTCPRCTAHRNWFAALAHEPEAVGSIGYRDPVRDTEEGIE